jgi:hypothetical protein
MTEPGLDLHEWETRWAELQGAVADDPVEALVERVRFVQQVLEARGFQLDEPVTAEGVDLDIVRDFLAAREIAAAAEAGGTDRDDVATALDDLQEIYDYILNDRVPP